MDRGSERVVREVRQEVRREREFAEAAEAEHDASTSSFPVALMGLGSQGVELMIELPDRQLVGRICHVGSELVTLENLGGERFDIATWAIAGVRLTRGQARPISVSTGHPGSLVARLREVLVSQEAVALSRRIGAPMSGRLRACSETHVEGVDHNGSHWLLPLPMITSIARI